MLGQPRKRFVAHSLSRQFRHHVVELEVEMSNPAVGQDDIGVEYLTGKRMNAAWPDGRADVVVEPTNKVVLHVFGIKVHEGAGTCVLVVDFDMASEKPTFSKALFQYSIPCFTQRR